MPDGWVLLAILAMAAAAYATKAAGVALLGADRLPPAVRAVLRHAPGAVIVALVAPVVVEGGWPMAVGAVVSATVSARTRNLVAAALAGVVSVGLLMAAFPA